MIIGIGIDIVNINRIKNSIDRYSGQFFNRIFTANEINYAKKYGGFAYQKFATRFAAKEACLKALGTGYTLGIGFRDIEVIKTENSAPTIELHGKALEYMTEKYSQYKIFLSLSDDDPFAIANVIIEGELK